jgi:hypothetical protein
MVPTGLYDALHITRAQLTSMNSKFNASKLSNADIDDARRRRSYNK